VQEIGTGIYVYTGFRGANVGCIVTGAGVILVDTPMIPEEVARWKEMIASVTDQPIIYIVNTDHHRAHILGNQHISAPVIAHEAAWKEMSSYSDSFIQRTKDLFKNEPEASAQLADLEIIPPQITFTERLVLLKGGREIHLIYVGGHTPATIMVSIPSEGVLFTGDVVVNGQHPAMGQANTKEWLDVLTNIRRMKLNVLVPGHGPLCNVDATYPVSDYIRQARSRVRSLYRAGKSKSDVSSLISEMAGLYPFPPEEKARVEKRVRAGLNRVYDEMKVEYGED
jgi:cyclase